VNVPGEEPLKHWTEPLKQWKEANNLYLYEFLFKAHGLVVRRPDSVISTYGICHIEGMHAFERELIDL
jgi:hypothetical protein